MFVESIGSNTESESLHDSPNCYNNQAFLSFEIIGYSELDMITFNYAPKQDCFWYVINKDDHTQASLSHTGFE